MSEMMQAGSRANSTLALRCLWSGRSDAGTRHVEFDPGPGFRAEPVAVCPRHEAELLRFLRGAHRNQYRFLGGIGLIMVLAIIAALSGSDALLTLMLFVAAGIIFAWPFATPQTIALLGVVRSVLLVRGFAVAALVWGAWRLISGLTGGS